MFRINCNPFEAVFPMCQRGRIVQKILNGGRYKTFFCICTCAAIFISAVYGAADQHQAEVFSAYILGAFVFAASIAVSETASCEYVLWICAAPNRKMPGRRF